MRFFPRALFSLAFFRCAYFRCAFFQCAFFLEPFLGCRLRIWNRFRFLKKRFEPIWNSNFFKFLMEKDNGDPWGIEGIRVVGDPRRSKSWNKIVQKFKKLAKSKKVGKFSIDLKWCNSHCQGNQAPPKLKSRSKNSKNWRNRKKNLNYFLDIRIFSIFFWFLVENDCSH